MHASLGSKVAVFVASILTAVAVMSAVIRESGYPPAGKQ